MAEIKVITRTTYIIDIPISFDEISEPKMTIEESDEYIKGFLRDKFRARVDEVLWVDEVKYRKN